MTRFDKLRKLRVILASLTLPKLLNPIQSKRQLVLWLFLCLGIELVAANLINTLMGSFPSFTWEVFKNLLLFTSFMGVAEEIVLRGFFKLILGNAGLVMGTLLWIAFHQFDATPPPLHRIPGDILWGIFYIKLWRGKYWRLSMIIHPLWNIGILLWWQLAIPAIK